MGGSDGYPRGLCVYTRDLHMRHFSDWIPTLLEMTDKLPETYSTCAKCGKCQAPSEFYKRNTKLGRRSRCRTCEKAAKVEWRRGHYDSTKTDFRQSPHVNSPNMRLRYHLVDPVQGELVATAATREEAREAAIDYHQRRRVRIKFVEIYDEVAQEMFHLTRPTKRYARGIMRGPCESAPFDDQARIGRGPSKKSLLKQQATGG